MGGIMSSTTDNQVRKPYYEAAVAHLQAADGEADHAPRAARTIDFLSSTSRAPSTTPQELRHAYVPHHGHRAPGRRPAQPRQRIRLHLRQCMLLRSALGALIDRRQVKAIMRATPDCPPGVFSTAPPTPTSTSAARRMRRGSLLGPRSTMAAAVTSVRRRSASPNCRNPRCVYMCTCTCDVCVCHVDPACGWRGATACVMYV